MDVWMCVCVCVYVCVCVCVCVLDRFWSDRVYFYIYLFIESHINFVRY